MEKINNSDDEFYDNIEIESQSKNKTGKKKKTDTKKNVDIIQMCDDLEMKLTESFKTHRNEIRKLKREYQKKLKKIDKRTTNTNTSGIKKASRIPNNLADLIDVKRGTELTRIELGKRIHHIFKSRDLLYENDK